ncbi:hypothetical protein RNJ44_02759 [Nakaseomyces bracarensis]|uniref:Increased recombination centers protein 6 n=1 Tax=Nakaseomyces bracarensis TaxID=273131 RepID=A0ABR4P072_9SACH
MLETTNSPESEFIDVSDVDSYDETKLVPNKVLIVMSGVDKSDKHKILNDIFQVESGESIYKNLTWETKYYRVDYDLYVDECEDILEWLKEISSDEYTELRELLTSIIVVRDFAVKEDDELEEQLKELLKECPQEPLLAGIHIGEPIDITRRNVDYSLRDLSLEICDINDTSKSENNELMGLKRVVEIIDTHSWPDCAMILDTDIQPSSSNKEADLEHLIHKLQEAKLHYEHLVRDADADQDEALEYAQQIAEEIAREL